MKILGDELKYNGYNWLLTPVKPGSNLAQEALESREATKDDAKKYALVIGMLLHVTRNSRPDIMNPVRECSGYMSNVKKVCVKHCNNLCNWIVCTKERGYVIQPDEVSTWDGTHNFLFKVTGESDADWAKHPSRKSINCWRVSMYGTLPRSISTTTKKREIQKLIYLSIISQN